MEQPVALNNNRDPRQQENTDLSAVNLPARDIYVIEQTQRGERVADIFSRLLQERIITLDFPINDNVASLVNAQLNYLAAMDKNKDIELHLNSPGGVVTSGLAILDTMDAIPNDVRVTVRGQAASMGAVLLAGGTPGKRGALPNARIMIHQVRGGAEGTLDEMKISIQEADDLNHILMKILAERTGKPLDQVIRDCSRDKFMSAEQALEYGIIDVIYYPKGPKYRPGCEPK